MTDSLSFHGVLKGHSGWVRARSGRERSDDDVDATAEGEGSGEACVLT